MKLKFLSLLGFIMVLLGFSLLVYAYTPIQDENGDGIPDTQQEDQDYPPEYDQGTGNGDGTDNGDSEPPPDNGDTGDGDEEPPPEREPPWEFEPSVIHDLPSAEFNMEYLAVAIILIGFVLMVIGRF